MDNNEYSGLINSLMAHLNTAEAFNDTARDVIGFINNSPVLQTDEDRDRAFLDVYANLDPNRKREFVEIVDRSPEVGRATKIKMIGNAYRDTHPTNDTVEPEHQADILTPPEDLNPLVEPGSTPEEENSMVQDIINDIKTKDVCEIIIRDDVIQRFTFNNALKLRTLKEVFEKLNREEQDELINIVSQDEELDVDFKKNFADFAAASRAQNVGNQADTKAAPANDEPVQDEPQAAPANDEPVQDEPQAAPADDEPVQDEPQAAPVDDEPVQDEPKKDISDEDLSDMVMNDDTGVYDVFGDDDDQKKDKPKDGPSDEDLSNIVMNGDTGIYDVFGDDDTTKAAPIAPADDKDTKDADTPDNNGNDNNNDDNNDNNDNDQEDKDKKPNPFDVWPGPSNPQDMPGIELNDPQAQTIDNFGAETKEPEKKTFKVVAKKALKWAKEHKKLLIGIGLGTLAVALYLNPATHMMINSALWNLGHSLGWKAAFLDRLHLTNLGLATAVKGGSYSFISEGLYTLGGKVGAEALYTAAQANLVGALTGMAGIGSVGLIASSIKDKIKNRGKNKTKDRETTVTEGAFVENVEESDRTQELEQQIALLNSQVIGLKNQLEEAQAREREYMATLTELRATLEELRNQGRTAPDIPVPDIDQTQGDDSHAR